MVTMATVVMCVCVSTVSFVVVVVVVDGGGGGCYREPASHR